NYKERDKKVQSLVRELELFQDRFIFLNKPDSLTFTNWYSELIKTYPLPHYLSIDKPDPWLMQVRYQGPGDSEILFFSNSHLENTQRTKLKIDDNICSGRSVWIWDPESGEKYPLALNSDNTFELNLGPAQSMIIVFDNSRTDIAEALPSASNKLRELKGPWELEFIHCRGEKYNTLTLNTLRDLSQLEEYKYFSGKIIYRTTLDMDSNIADYMELTDVYDIAELSINGINCGCRWYGNRIFEIRNAIKPGKNNVEITVITLMGNYMKSLTENPNAQYWTNEKRKNQDITALGLAGRVVLYNR
ncbi:MAG: hypothetical protein QNK33_04575, partial [Bacteroidales bacterium]|nr:hypothetical protein [Bacteroidales bacterium]